MYSRNPSMFRSNPIGFIVVLTLCFFVVGIPILLYWWLLSKCTKLSVTENEILLEEGIFSKTRSEVSIKTVRTTKIHQSFFQRIFGVGRIEIYTAGDDPEITASGLPSPNEVRDLIKKYQAE